MHMFAPWMLDADFASIFNLFQVAFVLCREWQNNLIHSSAPSVSLHSVILSTMRSQLSVDRQLPADTCHGCQLRSETDCKVSCCHAVSQTHIEQNIFCCLWVETKELHSMSFAQHIRANAHPDTPLLSIIAYDDDAHSYVTTHCHITSYKACMYAISFSLPW